MVADGEEGGDAVAWRGGVVVVSGGADDGEADSGDGGFGRESCFD